MKTCVFGVGAVGGVIAGRLALAGQPVSAIARGATRSALETHGLILEQDGQRHALPLRVAASPAELGPQDLLVIAVKAPALAAVAAAAQPLIGPRTRVLLAMNGVPWWFLDGLPGPLQGRRLHCLDPDGRLAASLPSDQLIGCVVHFASSTPRPGQSRLAMGNRLILGEPAGPASPATVAAAELLRRAGFQVEVSERIQRDIWFKLWGNMTMNPVSALTGATTDRILDDPLVNAFCVSIMDEAARLGERIGCPVGQSPQQRNAVTRELGAMKTSMLQDVEAGRPLELEAMLGAVLEIAAAAGEPVPQLCALYGLARLFAQSRGLA